MARKLAATVHVTLDGQRHSLLAGTSPSDELAALVTNPAAWADEPETAPAADPEPEPEPAPADEPTPPSRGKRRQG